MAFLLLCFHTKHGVLSIKTKLIWNGRYETPAGKRGQGRPRRREASRTDHPRKARAWSGNQRSSFTNKKNIGNMEFYLVKLN
ncbi:hypothetical protein SRABI80_00959 [Peribacillus frigoritolerans]|nr:hypothetical protein SRABI80_00959 [Peribacillus frigoritolerans]